MSKNNGGYMGQQIGKLGPAVGRRWRGMNVYAGYQKFVKNPRTEGQMAVRAKFGALASLSRCLRGATKKGLADIKTIWDGNNAFMHINWPAVSGATAPEVAISYADIVVSRGNLPGVSFGTPDFEEELTVKVPITGTNIDVPGAMESDLIYIIAYQPDLKQGILSTPVLRTSGDISLIVPAAWSGMRAHVWGFCVGAPNNEMPNEPSDSYFVGTGNIG